MYTLNMAVSDKSTDKAKELASFVEADSKYKIARLIAKSGMSFVFAAKDTKCRRQVALKMMRPDKQYSSSMIQHFIDEAQITAQLDHPSIIPIYDLCKGENGEPYYTMKLVHGETLEEILEKVKKGDPAYLKKYSLEKLIDIFLKVCEVITYTTSKHVVHRDLKAENIMVGKFGQVYVMDWGISKVCTPLETKQLMRRTLSSDYDHGFIQSYSDMEETNADETNNKSFSGTPIYMAPEQIFSELEIDTRADIYSLGVILYQMLYLDVPFKQKTVKELFEAKLKGDTEFQPQLAKNYPHMKRESFPKVLHMIIQKAMHIDVSQRYQSANDIAKDLHAWSTGYATEAEGASQLVLVRLLFLRHKKLSFYFALFITTLSLFIYQIELNNEVLNIENNFMRESLSEQNYKQKRNLMAKLKLENEISLYKSHIHELESELNSLELNDKNINRAIYISEQLTSWEPKASHYQKLIELYILKKDFESAGKTLAHALAIYPKNKNLLELVNQME